MAISKKVYNYVLKYFQFLMIYLFELLGKAGNLAARFTTPMLLGLCLTTGCAHSPGKYMPNTWMGSPTHMKSIADRPNQSRLQVIIMSGKLLDHHTALRLVCPGRTILFWDPAGGYGKTDPKIERDNDLIRTNPPDLKTYMPFRWQNNDAVVVIFEWNLPPDHAWELYEVLNEGTGKDHPAGRFSTITVGLFCSTAISDFLRRFAQETVSLKKSYFLPRDLARELYTQSPTRVLVFRRDHQPMEYIQPQKTFADTLPMTMVK
jgi:hypothetical protein